LSDGEELPFWGGLRVIHLPGHTAGHCGFYSAKHDLLFSGDMFASYFFNVHRPPAILNSVPEHFPASVEKVRRLNPRWIVPSHYDYLDGELHRHRFAKLNRFEWPAPK
jgi:glyoxylase-like metal-dependent hydrolase (beta-lactamase superfamily II)